MNLSDFSSNFKLVNKVTYRKDASAIVESGDDNDRCIKFFHAERLAPCGRFSKLIWDGVKILPLSLSEKFHQFPWLSSPPLECVDTVSQCFMGLTFQEGA